MTWLEMTRLVSVAIPVRNGAQTLERTLAAVRRQELSEACTLELLVCDSGSGDRSVALARSYGAEVIEIAPERFSHGGTRNLLMERSHGDHVAFLTQDAVPEDDLWLARMLDGFSLGDDIGLVFGPYRPRADASLMVARELNEWFRRFSCDGRPRVDRLSAPERSLPSLALLGPRGFFTDANGCIARRAWRAVPFRSVGYAEDHLLAHDMMRAGYAKVYLPDARVIHSHDYSGWGWLRRSFDEARALAEVYGYVEPLEPRRTGLKIWGLVGADWRWAREHAARPSKGLLVRSTYQHTMRTTGAIMGSRADRLPLALKRRFSLEGRGG